MTYIFSLVSKTFRSMTEKWLKKQKKFKTSPCHGASRKTSFDQMPTVASSAQRRFTTELTNLCRAAPGHPIPAGKPRKPKSRAPPPPAADGQQKWVGLTDVPYVSIRGYGQWCGSLTDAGRSRMSAFALKPLYRGTEYCFFLNHQQHEAVAFDLKSVAFFFLGRFWFLLNHCFSDFCWIIAAIPAFRETYSHVAAV